MTERLILIGSPPKTVRVRSPCMFIVGAAKTGDLANGLFRALELEWEWADLAWQTCRLPEWADSAWRACRQSERAWLRWMWTTS